MPDILSQSAISRHITEYKMSDGTTQYKCKTLQSPDYYKTPAGQFLPIDVTANAVNGGSNIYGQNMMSVGLKVAPTAINLITLQPDEVQDGSERLSVTPVSIVLNMATQPLNLATRTAIDSNTTRFGTNLYVQVCKQRCRIMAGATNAATSFQVKLNLNTVGLTPTYMPDLDEWWFYNANGVFRFRLGHPYLVDPTTMDPLLDSKGNPYQGLVSHTLTGSAGSYVYTKSSTPAYTAIASTLPASFLIDTDPIYSSSADGYIYGTNSSVWATARGATTGTATSNGTGSSNAIRADQYDGINYNLYRSFFYYALPASGTVASVAEYLYGVSYNGSDVSTQQGLQADALVGTDFSQFSGASYAHLTWAISQYNVLTYNAQGISDVQAALNTTFKTCLREYTHDYLNSTTGLYMSYCANGCRFSEYTGTSQDPYLLVTMGAANNFTIQDSGSASSEDNVTLVGNLIIQDSASASSADNVALTQASGLLAIADSASLSSADTDTLVQNLNLVIQDSASLSTADNVSLIGNLIIADSASVSSADNDVIARNGGDLAIADSASLSTADNFALIGNLVIADSASLSSADNDVLAFNGGSLAIDDSASLSSADTPALIGNLIVADSTSLSSSDNVVVVFNGGVLVIADSASVSTADNVSLIGNLIVADATSLASADNVAVVRNGGDLTISDAASVSSADNVTMIASGSLGIQDSASLSYADIVTLIGNLQIDDSSSLSTADNLVINTVSSLVVQDSGSLSSADIVSLIGNLQVADSTSLASADNVTVARNGGDLAVNDSTSLSSADIMTLIGNLQIADSGSASLSDNVLLSQASGLFTINDSGSLSSAGNVVLSNTPYHFLPFYFNVRNDKLEYKINNALIFKQLIIDHTGRLDCIVKDFIITGL